MEERTLATSYQCLTNYVDSTNRYPFESPSLIVVSGKPMSFQLTFRQQPVKLDVKLYSGAKLYDDFFRWTREPPEGVQALNAIQPEPLCLPSSTCPSSLHATTRS